MFFADDCGQQIAVRSRDKAAHFRVKRQFDAVGAEHFLINGVYAFSGFRDVDGLLLRLVRDPDPACHIDEGKGDSQRFPDLKRQPEKLRCQRRVIVLLQRARCEHGMDAETGNSFFLKDPQRIEELFFFHAEFGVVHMAHDGIVGKAE